MNDTMDTTLTSSSVSVNNPLHHSPPAPHWGAPGGGVGVPCFNHQQHSQTPTGSAGTFLTGKTKSAVTSGGVVLANSVMQQLKSSDKGSVTSCSKDDLSVCDSSSLVTASSGSVTVISVQHGDKVHPEDGKILSTYCFIYFNSNSPLSSQCLPIDCWSYACLSTNKSERSSSQFRGDIWSAHRSHC